jgi:hypothetical protein
MISPRYFILAASEEQLIKGLDGCSDPLRAAEFNGLKIIDKKNRKQYEMWLKLSEERKRQKADSSRKV